MMEEMSKMSAYKAHRLHVAWIQLLTGIYTLWSSIKIIFISIFSKEPQRSITAVTRLWGRKLIAPTGLVLKVKGAEHIEQSRGKPTVIMCNHTSLYDIPVSFLSLDVDLRMIAKKELFNIPVLSTALNKGDFVSIDRNNIEQAKKDLQVAETKLKKGIVLWVAPEGTRSRDGKLRPFKKGGFHLAIDTNAQIIPVAIKGLDKVLPSNSYDLIINGQVEIEIGEPIDSAGYDKKSCNELIQITRNAMLELLGENYND